MTVLLSKIKSDGSIEYSPVYFNSTTKTVINNKYSLDQSFQEILYRIDNWINQGSGWIIDKIHNQYLNINSYSPLIGNTYIEFPNELKHSKKGLINIQNDDNKLFLWCHARHLNPIDKNPQRTTKKFANNLNYDFDYDYLNLAFLFQKNIIIKFNRKIKLVLMGFVTKIKQLILFIYQIKTRAWIYC